MSQSRRGSAIEAATNIIVGCIINVGMNWILLPLVLHIPHPTLSENIILTAIFTVVSFIRSYGLRRLFNSIRSHHAGR